MQPPPLEVVAAPESRHLIVSAQWAVHRSDGEGDIPDVARAGADIELHSVAAASRIARANAAMPLSLTFWVEEPSGERRILAVFGEALSDFCPGSGQSVQPARFECTREADAFSLHVSGESTLLSLSAIDGAMSAGAIWCRSALHHLLQLEGGQYRLEDVWLDRERINSALAPRAAAREAV